MDFVMDSLVNPIVGLVRDSLLKHVLYALRVGDNVKALRRQAAILKDKRQDVKNDVEVQERGTSKKCTHQVLGWLERAQDIFRDSQKVEEDYQKRSCMLGTSCSLNCRSNHSISTRAVELRQRAEEELKLIGEVKDFVQETAPPPVQEVNTAVGSAPAAGGQLEALLEKALSFVRDDGEKKGTLGIWGMGGVGKTTLLKLINNSLQANKYIVVFVVASRGCTEEKLQILIADNQQISKEGNVSNNIFEFLRAKDFVLLVDDLWEPLNFEDVGIPHPLGTYGGHRRKVILTTRSRGVCGKMGTSSNIYMECLKWDEAWALFRENVGDDLLNSNPQIMELAQNVARECDGLPLALITVARAMVLKDAVEVWEDALDKLRTSRMLEITDIGGTTGTTKDPISILKVSYDYLPTTPHRLKDCFLYCALWPEDYAIEKDDLIQCWMGHGLLQDRFDNIGEVYREGHVIIDALLKACLLENAEEKYSVYLKNSHVKMHDLTRDMALWVARDCGANKKKWLVSDNRIETATEGTDKISFMSVEVRISTIGNWSNITTLIIREIKLDIKDVANIRYCSLLKYLDLSSCELKMVPVEICRLDKLEYFNLSDNVGIDSIPEEAKYLVNLKYLYLRSTRIPSIPSGVLKSLQKLLVLDITTGDVDHSEIIDWLEDTSTSMRLSLKALGINVSTKSEFDKLANLSSVSMTVLVIVGMENTSTIHLLSDNFLGRPHMHSDLKVLVIYKCKALERLVLDQGRLRMGTKTMWLYRLEVLKEIIWKEVRPWDVLPNLRELTIGGCDGLENVSWVALLPCLEKLQLMDCRSLKCIVGEEEQVPVGAVAFPSLRILVLFRLPNLRSISEQELAFPSLELIGVDKCSLLKKLLPFGSGGASSSSSSASLYFPRLQSILGEKSWWDSLELEDNLRTSLLPFFKSLR